MSDRPFNYVPVHDPGPEMQWSNVMRMELQEELFRRYPQLFRRPGMRLIDPAITGNTSLALEDDSAPFDQRGIECGDEWFEVVDRLSAACETEINEFIARGGARHSWPRIAQIKEKFGTLRFYVRGRLSDDLRELIMQASNDSLSNDL